MSSSENDNTNAPVIGRFAPSPTGRMHAGNIYAYLIAWLSAKRLGGSIVLRIEDLDAQRSKPEFTDMLKRDLEALGLVWDKEAEQQSRRGSYYENRLNSLQERGLIYPCFYTRADLHSASAPHVGERYIYTRHCKDLDDASIECYRKEGRRPSLRLEVPEKTISFIDDIQGEFAQDLLHGFGDPVLRRADGNFAYQLAVVVDDAADGITSVVRGADLIDSTPIQIHLQDLLGFEHPRYAHIPLIVDDEGRRLSKRDLDANLDALLETYRTPEAIIGHIAFISNLIPEDEPISPEQLLKVDGLDPLETLKGLDSIRWR